jgi:hypothetical protein
MAVGALATRMIGRPQMARFAIGIGPVVEMDLAPGAGVVAIRALAGPVSSRRHMTPRTVGPVSVVKADRHPTPGVVTTGTLVDVMLRGGCIMARLAVGRDVTVIKV